MEETDAAVVRRGLGAGRLRFRTLLGGILGGALACGSLWAADGLLTFADEAIAAAGENPSAATSIRLARLVAWQRFGNDVIALSLMGQALGGVGFLAMQQGRSVRRLAVGTLWSCAVGLGLGSLAGLVGFTAFRTQYVGDQDLVAAAAIQGSVWALLGLAAGLGSSRGSLASPVGRRRLASAGLVGGLLWGAFYPWAAAQASPWAYVEQLTPDAAWRRAAWSVLGGAAVGLALGRSAKEPGRDDAAPRNARSTLTDIGNRT